MPESGVDCPLIQFRDSHICVSLVKVFPLGQSKRSTLKVRSDAGKVRRDTARPAAGRDRTGPGSGPRMGRGRPRRYRSPGGEQRRGEDRKGKESRAEQSKAEQSRGAQQGGRCAGPARTCRSAGCPVRWQRGSIFLPPGISSIYLFVSPRGTSNFLSPKLHVS